MLSATAAVVREISTKYYAQASNFLARFFHFAQNRTQMPNDLELYYESETRAQ